MRTVPALTSVRRLWTTQGLVLFDEIEMLP
jgi:hypothetical protein